MPNKSKLKERTLIPAAWSGMPKMVWVTLMLKARTTLNLVRPQVVPAGNTLTLDTPGQIEKPEHEAAAPNLIGVRDDEGSIVPLPAKVLKGKNASAESPGDAHYVGAKIDVPQRVGDLVCQTVSQLCRIIPILNLEKVNSSAPSDEVPETQQIAETQLITEVAPRNRSPSLSPVPSTSTPRPRRPTPRMSTRSRVSSLPPSDMDEMSIPSVSSYPNQETIETQALQDLLIGTGNDTDEVMLSTFFNDMFYSLVNLDSSYRHGNAS